MTRPYQLTKYDEIDLKLGIKSSLPEVKSTLGLAILFFEASEGKSELKYSNSQGNQIIIDDRLKSKLLKKNQDILNAASITEEDFIEIVNKNPLFKSQLEALIVVFELIWKLAEVDFIDDKPASAERTGGARFEKEINFTINADVIHEVIGDDRDEYYKVLLSWIGLTVEKEKKYEDRLISILSILSEGAIYKLVDGENDIIFNQNSIYKALIDTKSSVNIKSDKEAKGSLRILNSALKDELNPNVSYNNWVVSGVDDKELELEEYQKRVETFLKLSSQKVNTIVNEVDINSEAEEKNFSEESSSSNYITNFKTDFPHNRIIFGAPGTGKSYTLEKERKKLLSDGGECERVTFHPDYSYANFVGTYKPTMVETDPLLNVDGDEKSILSVLLDEKKTAQEKYDLLYDKFKDGDLTRLPLLLGLYTDDKFNTRKKDGTNAAGDNSVERNHGRAIRRFVNLISNKNIVSEISYEYVPGPFMRIYVKALKNARTLNPKPYLLIVEEINRANVAAVFGDVFQLLDRDNDNVSEYSIQASEDMKKYLAKELGGNPSEYSEIKLPDNMFIWASMNSADQGVFPMDTAFKRRWDFTYQGIDEGEDDIKECEISLGESGAKVNWNQLRKAINDELLSYNVNEDKLLGPHFISKGALQDSQIFKEVFKNKVIMYLFDDAAKQKRPSLFSGAVNPRLYSAICSDFDKRGIEIFAEGIRNKFAVFSVEDEE
ncbi:MULTISPECIES: AAA family ATPase [Bacillus cereus group]|uniref:AAA family ATPase n=1 Tax=Bacillus cereus group TaxID=86661 RepID=UPI0018F53E94|nr:MULTISPECIES: AAA family ATPase [Bacillus cereus group]MBJ8129373.1 AAA family ATPase [Bacillus cereus group sp. N3]MCH5469533.1 AAA family ATPase [Bacillus toyonensis]